MPENETRLDMPEVMARLNLRPAEVYREIKAGTLTCTGENDALLFDLESVDTFGKKCKEEADTLMAEISEWQGRTATLTGTTVDDSEREAASKDEAAQIENLVERLFLAASMSHFHALAVDPVRKGCRILFRRPGTTNAIGQMSLPLTDRIRQSIKVLMGYPEPATQPISAVFWTTIGGTECQVRGTILPTRMGEHLHIEIHNDTQAIELSDVGYSSRQALEARQVLTGRPGLFLTVGAIDGLAARHHSVLAEILGGRERLIVSLEHGTHFRSERLVQLSIGKENQGEFDTVFQATLAMEPDVVLLDDVRGEVEGRSLFEAVGAGATVVAQVRASDNARALLSLRAMGIDGETLARDLLGLASLRALPRLCRKCRKERLTTSDETELLHLSQPATVALPDSCEFCGDGFDGHQILCDLWLNRPELAEMLRREAPGETDLRAAAANDSYAWCCGLQEAVLAGDVCVEHALPLLRGHPGWVTDQSPIRIVQETTETQNEGGAI